MQLSRAVVSHYKEIRAALLAICTDQDQSLETKVEANGLAKKMGQLEVAIMAVTWHTILERFNATSLAIQGIEIDLY